MKLAQAQALVPGLMVYDADPEGDAAELLGLAEWCLRYAPLAAVDAPDGLWIDVSGSAHLHGGEARLLRDLEQRLAEQGLRARAAVADTPAVAHAVARFADGGVVPPGASVPPDLPLEALRLPAEVAADLRLMGFDRIGPLAAAARAPLVRRYGTLLALRLDQAAGRVFEPIEPVVPAALLQARLGFVEPLLTAAAFSVVIARLVASVCGDLERAAQGRGAWICCSSGWTAACRPCASAPRGRCAMPGISGACWMSGWSKSIPARGWRRCGWWSPLPNLWRWSQSASSLVAPPAADIAPLVDRLANRLGEAAVYRIAPVESHVPERSVRRVAPMVAVAGGWPADLPRPVRLLDPPQPVEAMALLPDDPPVAFTWRRVRHRVRRADGPERIAGEWWKRERERFAVRDYFRVEDEDGRRFWLFRRGNGRDPETGDMRWFLHGFF